MDIILLILLGLITLFAVINCAIRGWKRSLVRLAFVVAAAVIALFLTPVLGKILARQLPFWEFSADSSLGKLAASSPTLGAAVHGAASAAWSVLIYPLVFLLLCLLMTIPVSIINRHTKRTKKGVGALIGIAVGIIGFSLAFAPLCAAFGIALDAVPEMILDELDVADLNDMYGLSLDPEQLLHRAHVLRAEAIPGKPMLDLLTGVRENGKRISLSKELGNLKTLIPLYAELEKDMEKLPELLPAMADCAENSAFLSDTVDELQTAGREKWTNGEDFLGYDPKDPDGGLMEYFAKVLCDSKANLTVRELAEEFEALINAKIRP